jgi:hypothetical protein
MEITKSAVTAWLGSVVNELRKQPVLGRLIAVIVVVGCTIAWRRHKQPAPQQPPGPNMQPPLDKQEFRSFKLLERHILSPSVRLFVFEVRTARRTFPSSDAACCMAGAAWRNAQSPHGEARTARVYAAGWPSGSALVSMRACQCP